MRREDFADEVALSVSDFVAYVNQTLEMAYQFVAVEGELSNFRMSKGKWVYFDLKDEAATIRCFGMTYMLPGPLEDGMVVRVFGTPRLHPQYNFSLTVQQIVPVGEGALRRVAELLVQKLSREGLFDDDRKRPLPYPPQHIALITSGESAAYADFVTIAAARWAALTVDHYNVLVQGEQAPEQIVTSLKQANEASEPPEVIVLIRGGGSAEDLAAWNDERVVRAVAGSRAPTVVAIGHEVDVSLAERAADKRASTPSNAAEVLLPDKREVLRSLHRSAQEISYAVRACLQTNTTALEHRRQSLDQLMTEVFERVRGGIASYQNLLSAYDPLRPLMQGFALITRDGMTIRSSQQVKTGDMLQIRLSDGTVQSQVKQVQGVPDDEQ